MKTVPSSTHMCMCFLPLKMASLVTHFALLSYDVNCIRSANREDGARLDIVAENFWGRERQNAFFDVMVFNPYAPSHRGTTLVQCYRLRNEQEKKRAYEERVREVEHGSFSPLIFSTSGGMGPIATVVYKRIATESCPHNREQTFRTTRSPQPL